MVLFVCVYVVLAVGCYSPKVQVGGSLAEDCKQGIGSSIISLVVRRGGLVSPEREHCP